MNRLLQPLRAQILLAFLPLAIYVALVVAMGDWIMDDAGISYAYSRNLASGHGFVSQPGRPPVEGFSNSLWVLLLAPFFPLGLFHPVMTPKAVASLLVLMSFVILQRTLYRQLGDPVPALLASVLIAGAPPIVIWTSSGLENSLTMVLAVALYARLVEAPPRWEVHGGILTALLAMTHPENGLYVAAGVLVGAGSAVARRQSLREAGEATARYVGWFATLYVPFLVFRLILFGLPFPHTYYAKRNHLSFLDQLGALLRNPADTGNKLLDLASGIGGPLGPALLPVTLCATFYLAWRGRLGRALGVAVAIQLVAVGTYVWMDRDWMGEYRFATVATVFSLLSLVLAGFAIGNDLLAARGRRWVTAAYMVLVAVLFTAYLPRVARFAENPPTEFNDVARQYAFKFDAYADILGLARASVFLPDIGATLYYSRLTVHDAAGLIEPEVIRTLKAGTIYWRDHHPEFYEYVFETIKPTFINTHHFFTRTTAFERDPRFARDYVAVNAYLDVWLRNTYGWVLHSGDWVRKDVLRSPADLERLRAGYRAAPRPEAPTQRWRDSVLAWLGRDVDQSPEALIRAGLKARHTDRNPNRAAILFRRALERSPGNMGAAHQLAAALDAASRPDEARPIWRTVHDLALARNDQRILDEARARLDSAYAPGAEDWMRAGLTALYTLRDPHRAVEQFRKVLQEKPKHYGATFQLAAALDAAGKPGEARLFWEKVLEMATGINDEKTAATARRRLGPVPGAAGN